MKYIFLIFAIFLFSTSCSQGFRDVKTAEAYISSLEGQSLTGIKAQIKKDTVVLNDLLKNSSFTIQLVSHFSSGQKHSPDKAVEEFSINADLKKLNASFLNYIKYYSFEQDFDETYNKQEIKIFKNERFTYSNVLLSEDSIFESCKSKILVTPKQFFHQGKPIAEGNIGLKRIDSIDTEIELKIPLAYDKFTINKNQKNYKYKNFDVRVEKIKENTAQIVVPVQLNNNILAFQAYNSQAKRMNSTSFSSVPVLEVSSKVKRNLNELKEIFIKILAENDEAKAKQLIKEINQMHFDTKNSMVDFVDYLYKLKKENRKLEDFGDDITLYEEIAEAGKNVLSSEHELLFVEFDDDLQSIDVFVGTDFTVLKESKTVGYSSNIFHHAQTPNIIYYKYVKGKGTKYGLIDKFGNKIMDATYDRFYQASNDFFFLDDKLHYFNKEKGSLVVLEDYSGFHKNIKPGYDILEKKSGDNVVFGVVKDAKEVIMPFQYSYIDKFNNFLVAKKGLTSKIEIFDYNFKKIPREDISNLHLINEFVSTNIDFPVLYVAENNLNKKALLNSDLQLLTPFKYEFITVFSEVNNYFIVGVRTADGHGYLYGLINEKGEEVTPINFCYINEFFEEGKVKFCLKDKNSFLAFPDFIKAYKK